MFTIDTNIIIHYFAQDDKVVDFLDSILKQNSLIYVSTITELELFSLNSLTEAELIFIDNVLKTINIITVDSQLARLAGFLRSKYKIKTPDSVIAATAIFTGTVLITRNVKDFNKIKELEIQAV